MQQVKRNGRSIGQGDATTAQREQIERILGSSAFRSRDSLKRLLAYLAERTIDGSAGDLKEYTIGIEVFHKPDGCDPQQDGSVRQHVSKLRQKLDEYYRSEGNQDPVRIELPKRQFQLEFLEPEPSPAGSSRRIGYRLIAACLLLLLPGAYWLGTRHAANDLDPAVRLLWAPFLESPKPTVVCLGAPLFLRNRSFRVRDSHLNTIDTSSSSRKPSLAGTARAFGCSGPGRFIAANLGVPLCPKKFGN